MIEVVNNICRKWRLGVRGSLEAGATTLALTVEDAHVAGTACNPNTHHKQNLSTSYTETPNFSENK